MAFMAEVQSRMALPICGALLCAFNILAPESRAATLADNFATATPGTGNLDLTASNGQATAEPFEPDHADIPANHSLWAIWVAP